MQVGISIASPEKKRLFTCLQGTGRPPGARFCRRGRGGWPRSSSRSPAYTPPPSVGGPEIPEKIKSWVKSDGLALSRWMQVRIKDFIIKSGHYCVFHPPSISVSFIYPPYHLYSLIEPNERGNNNI